MGLCFNFLGFHSTNHEFEYAFDRARVLGRQVPEGKVILWYYNSKTKADSS